MGGKRLPFWDRVTKSDGCWEWTGCRVKGYGQTTRNGVKVYAHRVSLEERLGRPLRPGFMALHHCDNPPCVNPAHLYEGTARDNSNDMYERGRSGLLGVARPDVTLRHTTALRERGMTPAYETSDDVGSWRFEDSIDAAGDLSRFIDRLSHGDRLPEQVA